MFCVLGVRPVLIQGTISQSLPLSGRVSASYHYECVRWTTSNTASPQSLENSAPPTKWVNTSCVSEKEK